MRVLLSEWLRTKRTAIRWFIFGLPVFLAGCTVVYLTLSPGSTQDFAFEGFFTIWSGIMIPVSVGILGGAVIREEELAGNFNGFLSFGVSRAKIFLGKFMLVVICTFICTLLTALILGCGMNLFVPCGADMKVFLLAAVFTSIGAVPLLVLHLWISLAWGWGASIGLSFGGLLMAVIFGTTSLGASVWKFIPWTWPVKLGLLPGTVYIRLADGNFRALINQAAETGITALSAVFIALVLLLSTGILWFAKWEGRRSGE